MPVRTIQPLPMDELRTMRMRRITQMSRAPARTPALLIRAARFRGLRNGEPRRTMRPSRIRTTRRRPITQPLRIRITLRRRTIPSSRLRIQRLAQPRPRLRNGRTAARHTPIMFLVRRRRTRLIPITLLLLGRTIPRWHTTRNVQPLRQHRNRHRVLRLTRVRRLSMPASRPRGLLRIRASRLSVPRLRIRASRPSTPQLRMRASRLRSMPLRLMKARLIRANLAPNQNRAEAWLALKASDWERA